MTDTDKRILNLIELLKQRGVIRFDKQFCDEIGMSPQHLINIKKNSRHFTPEYLGKIIKAFNVNPYWIFGLSEKPFAHTNSHTIMTKID